MKPLTNEIHGKDSTLDISKMEEVKTFIDDYSPTRKQKQPKMVENKVANAKISKIKPII